MMTMPTTIPPEMQSIFFSGGILRLEQIAKGNALRQAGDHKPVAANGEGVGDGKSNPGRDDHIQIQGAVLQGDIVNAHPEHHKRTHNYRINQTFPLVLRHIQTSFHIHSRTECHYHSMPDFVGVIVIFSEYCGESTGLFRNKMPKHECRASLPLQEVFCRA